MSLTPFDIVQGYINTTHKSAVLGITNSVPMTNFSPVMGELEKVLNEASKIDSDFEQYIQVGLELQRADMLMQEGILRGIDEFCVGFIKGFSDAVNNQIHSGGVGVGVGGNTNGGAASNGNSNNTLFDTEYGGGAGANNIVTVTTNSNNNTITVTTSSNDDGQHHKSAGSNKFTSNSASGSSSGASSHTINNNSINNLKHILPESFLSLLREQNLSDQQKRDRDLVFGLNDNRRKTSLPKKAIKHLKAWLYENRYNPYPDEKEKKTLMDDTGLTWNQISHWFINARRRYLQSMVEGSSQREWEHIKTEVQDRQVEDNEIVPEAEEEDDDEEFDEEEALYVKTNKRGRAGGKGKGAAKGGPSKKKYIRKSS